MNSLLDDDEEDLQRERELTLSTGVILGIFLVLVVLCGAFFGMGYKMGSRQPVPMTAVEAGGAQPSTGLFSGFKPAAGSPMTSSPAPGSVPAPAPRLGSVSGEVRSAASPAGSAPSAVAPARTAVPAATAPEPPAVTGNFVVQVAAVSHEEDAQLLVSALRAKGYPVNAHADSNDKFFHIQVGPYTNMKDATAAKQKLIADGYQPIIK